MKQVANVASNALQHYLTVRTVETVVSKPKCKLMSMFFWGARAHKIDYKHVTVMMWSDDPVHIRPIMKTTLTEPRRTPCIGIASGACLTPTKPSTQPHELQHAAVRQAYRGAACLVEPEHSVDGANLHSRCLFEQVS